MALKAMNAGSFLDLESSLTRRADSLSGHNRKIFDQKEPF